MPGTLVARRFESPLSSVIPAHWLPGDPATSAVLNVYTVLVPSNEAFYMRTLAKCMPHIEDPVLRARAKAFIHQEAEHGVAHKRYWRILDAQGYRFRAAERWVDKGLLRLTERIAPLGLRMSMVSCVEHINAFMAHEFLRQRILETGHPEVRAMLEWHFAEEIEHKDVAFDVLDALWPNYAVRLFGCLNTAVLFYLMMTVGMLCFLAQDGALWKLSTWRGLWRHLGPGHRMARHTLRHLFDYLRPSFHPSHVHDKALADEVIARYAGPEYRWLKPSMRGADGAQAASEAA